MPVSCPNLTSPLYREVRSRWGDRGAYLLHVLLEHPEFQARAGRNPRVNPDLTIDLLDGTRVQVADLLEHYKTELGRQSLRPYVRGQKEGSSAINTLRALSKSKNEGIADVAGALLAHARLLEGVVVHIVDHLEGARGVYEYQGENRRITLSASSFSGLSDAEVEQVLLHEIVHPLTVHALRNPQTQEERDFRDRMYTLFRIAQTVLPTGEYGLTSVEEFVAEALSNPQFQIHLREVRSGSLWERFKGIVRRFLRLETNPVLDEVLTLLRQNEVTTQAPTFVGEGRFLMPEDPTPVLTKKEEAYAKVLRSLQRRVDDYANQKSDEKTEEERRKVEAEKEIISQALKRNEEGRLITRAIREAHSTVERLLQEFGEAYKTNTMSFGFMERVLRTIRGIDFLDDLYTLIEKTPELRRDHGDLLAEIDKIQRGIRLIERNYTELVVPMLASRTAKYDWRTERKYQRQFEKEFGPRDKQKHPTDEEYRDAKARYVSEKMEEKRSEIEMEKRERLARELRKGSGDIGTLSRWLRGFQDVGDDLVAIAKQILDRAMDRVRERYNPVEQKIEGFLERLQKEKGTVEPTKLYEDILEVDAEGNPTGYYISQFRLGEFEKAEKEFRARLEEETDPGEKAKMWGRWFRDNYEQEYTPEWYETIDRMTAEHPPEYYQIQEHIKDILKAYRTGEGTFAYEEIPTEVWEEIQRLTNERNKVRGKADKDLFKVAKLVPSEAWTKTNEVKKNSLSEEDYRKWFGLQHDSSENLLGMWTKLVPKDPQAWINKNYKGPGVLRQDKWGSKQYQKLMALPEGSTSREFYEFIMGLQDEMDKRRPQARRLGYRIPSMRKTSIEKLRSGEVSVQQMKESLKQATQITEDDTEFGLRIEDAEGNLSRQVPIFFTTKMDPQEMSYDIATVTARNAYFGFKYEETVRVAPELETMGRRMGDREVVARDKKGNPIETPSGLHTVRGEETNVHKAYMSLLQKELYGIKKHDERGVKVIEHLMGFNSNLLMGANVRAAISNLTVGQMMANIHFAVGGDISKKAWNRAYAVYTSKIGHNIADIGRAGKHSPINLLLEDYDGLNTFAGNRYDYVRGGRLARLTTDGSVFHGLTGMVEHFNQGLSLLAVLSDIRVMDGEGRYLTLSGETTENAAEAMTLYEAYEFKDRRPQIKEAVKKVRFDGRIMDWNEDTKFRVTQKTRGINKRLYGAYSDQNRGEIYRHLWGRAVMQMRGWLFPQWDRRWRGASLATVFQGQSTDIMDWELQDYFEGYYTSLSRFLVTVAREIPSLKLNVKVHWGEMSEMERMNVKKASIELLVMGMTTVAFTLLAQAAQEAGDDEEEVLYFAAYQMLRVRSEFAFFIYPPAMMDIAQDPAASLSTVSDAFSLLSQAVLNPFEEYERGDREGQLKLRARMEKFLPLWRQLESLPRSEDFINYYNFN